MKENNIMSKIRTLQITKCKRGNVSIPIKFIYIYIYIYI
jgi:hypothetical protein